MKKRSVGLWQLMGFAVTVLGGTLLHFLYDLSGGAVWLAPFSSVNESTFEHMKLLFWPMLVYAVVEWFFFREIDNFLCVKLRGTLTGLALIPILFYTYNGVIGKSPDFINITIFFVSAAVAFILETVLFKRGAKCKISKNICLSIIILIAFFFVVFTFRVPELAIFKDPLTGGYGI